MPTLSPRHSPRILVVEENEARALDLKKSLEQQGCIVRCAGDGPAGLDLMDDFSPDLLLVNALLPGMSGIDVCRQVRVWGSEVPVIILSSSTDEIDVVVALEIGADDFISDQCGLRELTAQIPRCCVGAVTWPALASGPHWWGSTTMSAAAPISTS